MTPTNSAVLAFYLFDTPSNIARFARLELVAERAELGLITVGVVSDDVVAPGYENEAFDYLFVLPATERIYDPGRLDTDEVCSIVREVFAEVHVPEDRVRIVSCGEYTTLVAAEVRTACGLTGPTVDQAISFRDKMAMKWQIAEEVRVPGSTHLDIARLRREPEEYFEMLAAVLGRPFIVKPVNLASSQGVRIIETCDDLEATEEYVGGLEAEQYIEGDQYHCEILYDNGRPVLSLVSRFNASQLDMMRGRTVGTIVLPQSDPIGRQICKFTDEACRALGARDGLTHTEVIVTHTDRSIFFIESAVRSPGGRVIECYRDAFGINIEELDLRLKSGLPYDPDLEDPRRYSFWAYIPRTAGKIAEYSPPDLSSTADLEWYVQPGETTSESTSFEEPAGLLFACNADYAALCDDFARILDHPFFVMSPAVTAV